MIWSPSRRPRRHIMRLWQHITLIMLIAAAVCTASACTPAPTPAPTPTPLPQSAWGPVYTVAYAPQLDAPAFAFLGDRFAFAWLASDAAGVHQDVRHLAAGGMTAAAALPLDPFAPHDLSAWPAAENSAMLLYLDEDSATETYRLYSAVFTEPHTLVRGPQRITDQATHQYTALPSESGGLWIVWSTGNTLESRLFAQQIDAFGRPQPAALLTTDADDPVLVRGADGHMLLFWIQPVTQIVYAAQLEAGALDDIRALGSGVVMQPGELRVDFNVIPMGDQFVLIWNTLLPTHTAQTYLSTAQLDPPALTMPTVAEAQLSDGTRHTLTWLTASPLSPLLSAAAVIGDDLGIVTWDGQRFTDFEPVITLDAPLIGLPALYGDSTGQRYLLWAAPRTESAAELRFTSTRAASTLSQ